LAIILVGLLLVTGGVYWFGQNDHQYAVDKNLFNNFDLKTIDQITLESINGKVDLKFNGSRWKVNEEFEAEASMIDVLFATLQRAEPKQPIANSLQDSTNAALTRDGVKVNLFTTGSKVYGFYAGGNAQKTKAIFKAEDDGQSHQVIIPGYRVYVSGIFELPEKDWRNRLVFAFNWRNFQQLDALFPEKDQDNFTVVMDKQFFGVKGLPQTDTTKLNDFLDQVSLLTVDEYLSASADSDSLFTGNPIMKINVTDIASRSYSLELYPFDKMRNQFPGLINGKDRSVFAVEKIRELFRPKQFFKP
nr:hypothetical protein [Chryseolinea sp.]